MNIETEEFYNNIFYNKVPSIWHSFAYPCLKPLGSWLDSFIERFDFIRKWIDEGEPAIFWIQGLF